MLHQEVGFLNCHPEQMSYNILREGGGLENLDSYVDFVKPWEILLDLGHSCSASQESLMRVLSDFKNMDEKTIALTILYLSMDHSGTEDAISRIVQQTFSSQKSGAPLNAKKDNEPKKEVSWNLDQLARGLRDVCPTMNWNLVSEVLAELTDSDLPESLMSQGMDGVQFQTFIQLF
jgi:hypothetical protein